MIGQASKKLFKLSKKVCKRGKRLHQSALESARRAVMNAVGCGSCTIVVMGKTGAGKSTLINSLLSRKEAKAAKGAGPVTMKPEPFRMEIKGLQFNIWDTAGLFDHHGPGDTYIADMKETIGEFHLVLLAVEVSDSVRFTYVDQQVMEMIHREFGDAIFHNMVIVFTKADLLLASCKNDVLRRKVKSINFHDAQRDLLDDWEREWRRCLREKIGVSVEVPMLPAGEINFNEKKPVPIGLHYPNWYSHLWTTCLLKSRDEAAITFIELARRQKRLGKQSTPHQPVTQAASAASANESNEREKPTPVGAPGGSDQHQHHGPAKRPASSVPVSPVVAVPKPAVHENVGPPVASKFRSRAATASGKLSRPTSVQEDRPSSMSLKEKVKMFALFQGESGSQTLPRMPHRRTQSTKVQSWRRSLPPEMGRSASPELLDQPTKADRCPAHTATLQPTAEDEAVTRLPEEQEEANRVGRLRAQELMQRIGKITTERNERQRSSTAAQRLNAERHPLQLQEADDTLGSTLDESGEGDNADDDCRGAAAESHVSLSDSDDSDIDSDSDTEAKDFEEAIRLEVPLPPSSVWRRLALRLKKGGRVAQFFGKGVNAIANKLQEAFEG